MPLRRVEPDFRECPDVFRKPDEHRHQQQTKQQRHRAADVPGLEMDSGAAEQPRGSGKQQPAQIDDEMMGEEVEIDRSAQRDQAAPPRMVRKAEIEQAPGAAEIAADAGIHEAREQRHAADAEKLGSG